MNQLVLVDRITLNPIAIRISDGELNINVVATATESELILKDTVTGSYYILFVSDGQIGWETTLLTTSSEITLEDYINVGNYWKLQISDGSLNYTVTSAPPTPVPSVKPAEPTSFTRVEKKKKRAKKVVIYRTYVYNVDGDKQYGVLYNYNVLGIKRIKVSYPIARCIGYKNFIKDISLVVSGRMLVLSNFLFETTGKNRHDIYKSFVIGDSKYDLDNNIDLEGHSLHPNKFNYEIAAKRSFKQNNELGVNGYRDISKALIALLLE